MKTAKILALIMTLAMLLSALLIPVDAMVLAGDGDNTYSGDPTALLLKDTTLDSGFQQSVWGTPTIDGTKDSLYQDYAYVKSNVNNVSGNTAYFDLWYANDGEYLYFYLNTKNLPSGCSFTNSKGLARFYIDFYNQHDQIHNAVKSAYQLYIENGKDNGQNYSDTEKLVGGQFTYTLLTSGTTADKSAYMGTLGENYQFVKVSDTEYILEGKILLPEYIQSTITGSEAERAVIGVGHEMRHKAWNSTTQKDEEKYVLGYFDADSYNYENCAEWTKIYDDYTLCPDLVLATETDNTEILTYKETCTEISNFALDGVMGAEEGWSTLPYAILDQLTSGTDDRTVSPVAYYDSRVYIGTDYKNLYIFVDSSRAINNTYVFLQLVTEGEALIHKDTNGNNVDGSDKFLYGQFKANGTYDLRRNGGANFKYTTAHAFGNSVCKYTDDCKAVEIKIPLSEDIRNDLKNGSVKFNADTFIRTANADNSGYTAQLGASNMGNKNWIEYYGEIIIPQAPATEPEEIPSAVQYEGFQIHDTDGKIRFVASLKGNYTEYSEIGFEFTNNGTKGEVNCTKVYTSILADGETLLPATFEADYFFCYTMHTFPEGTYDSFSVRCWTIKNGETEKQYSESRDYSFTVDANGDITVEK